MRSQVFCHTLNRGKIDLDIIKSQLCKILAAYKIADAFEYEIAYLVYCAVFLGSRNKYIGRNKTVFLAFQSEQSLCGIEPFLLQRIYRLIINLKFIFGYRFIYNDVNTAEDIIFLFLLYICGIKNAARIV